MPKEYLIYCDESVEKGVFYSDFYVGVFVDSDDLEQIIQTLEDCKEGLNLYNEVKWTKVTDYLQKARR